MCPTRRLTPYRSVGLTAVLSSHTLHTVGPLPCGCVGVGLTRAVLSGRVYQLWPSLSTWCQDNAAHKCHVYRAAGGRGGAVGGGGGEGGVIVSLEHQFLFVWCGFLHMSISSCSFNPFGFLQLTQRCGGGGGGGVHTHTHSKPRFLAPFLQDKAFHPMPEARGTYRNRHTLSPLLSSPLTLY